MTSTRWPDTLKALKNPPVVVMLFLGFSSGLPLLLIFSTLGLWLREAGVDRSAVTYFSWAALGYSFKFVWAPLVDRLHLPFLTQRLGRRRAWMLLAQLSVIIAIILMATSNPSQQNLILLAFACVLLGFSSATQDIVVDAYRIERADASLQGLMSSTYIAGYRMGMLVSGAFALWLAEQLGSIAGSYSYNAWKVTYLCMAGFMLIGVITTLLVKEPSPPPRDILSHKGGDAQLFGLFLVLVLCFVGGYLATQTISLHANERLNAVYNNTAIAAFFTECLRLSLALSASALAALLLTKANVVSKTLVFDSYILPISDFFKRYGLKLSLLILAIIGLYRISDIVLGVISNLFYQDLGFTKTEIAGVVKTFGLGMTLLGGFLGGFLVLRYSVLKILFVGAVLSAITNLFFLLLAKTGANTGLLYLVISADNLSAGLASAAFVAFLSNLTNVSFTAMQYAIFSSLMTLFPKIIGGYSGSMVNTIGYDHFFILTALMGLPVLILIHIAGKQFKSLKNPAPSPNR